MFTFALVMCLIAAVASWLRGAKPAEVLPDQGDLTEELTRSAEPSLASSDAVPVPVTTGVGPSGRADPPEGTRTRVVTISASFGAGGSQVGPALAERLGLAFFDRAVPLQVAERPGVPAESALAHDEQLQGALVRSLVNLIGAPVSFGVSGVQSRPTTDEHAFVQATEKVLSGLASGSGGVVLGRAGAVGPSLVSRRLPRPSGRSGRGQSRQGGS